MLACAASNGAMQHGSQPQQAVMFCIPAWSAAEGMSAGFWVPAQAQQSNAYRGEGPQPVAHRQLPHWHESNSLAEPSKLSSQATIPDWCNPNAKPFMPASHQDAVNKGADSLTRKISLPITQADTLTELSGDANHGETGCSAFPVRRKSRLINQTLGGAAPWQTGENGSHALNSEPTYDIEWTSTIRALNLEPKREKEVPIKSQLRPSAEIFQPAKQEQPQLAEVAASRTTEEVQPNSAQASGQTCASLDSSGGKGGQSNPSSRKLVDQRFDVQHSKSESRKGKGRNQGQNRDAGRSLYGREGGLEGEYREVRSQKGRAKDANNEDDKPMPVHEWPTLGAEPKKGSKDTTLPTAAIPSSNTPEVHSRVAGTAWGKAGGVVKQLRDAEEAKKAAFEGAKAKREDEASAAAAIKDVNAEMEGELNALGEDAAKFREEQERKHPIELEATRLREEQVAARKLGEVEEAKQRIEEQLTRQQLEKETAQKRREEEDNRLRQEREEQLRKEEAAAAQRLRDEQEQEAQRLREEQEAQMKREDGIQLLHAKGKAKIQVLCEKQLRQQQEPAVVHKGPDEEEQKEEEEEQRICSEEEHQQCRQAELKEEAMQSNEEDTVDGWEDDEWNDMSKPEKQQQQQRQQQATSQSKSPVNEVVEESGWDDDDWCVDEKADYRPAPTQQRGATEATSSNSRVKGMDAKKAVPELERETCAPSSSSDETEISHVSVTPRCAGAVDEESFPVDSLLRPAESKEVSNADLNAIRNTLLGFRWMACQTPMEIVQLCAVEDKTALRMALLADSLTSSPTAASDAPDRKIFGSRMRDGPRGMRGKEGGRTPGASSSNSKSQFLPTPSANAYRPKSAAEGIANREQEFRRSVQSLMNKICPENIGTISGRILELQVASTEELEVVITVIMKKACSEPHYCETYADLVYNLKAEMPEFPSPDGGKPVSFKSTLLNCCQNEFETIVSSAPEMSPEEVADLDPEEIAFQKQQRKAKTLANMKFIGHLFLRQLLTAKIIGSVIKDLVMCDAGDALPGEHVVECLCELLNSIGYTLETMPSGKDALVQVCSRMLDLKQRRDKSGKGAYSKRIQFQIQDLLDTRAAGWTKKVFKAAAKTKEEIRNEQDREIKAQSAGKGVDGGSHVIAGARPSYLAAGSTSSVDGGAWQDVPKAGRR